MLVDQPPIAYMVVSRHVPCTGEAYSAVQSLVLDRLELSGVCGLRWQSIVRTLEKMTIASRSSSPAVYEVDCDDPRRFRNHHS